MRLEYKVVVKPGRSSRQQYGLLLIASGAMFLALSWCMVAPLWSGSGTFVKIRRRRGMTSSEHVCILSRRPSAFSCTVSEVYSWSHLRQTEQGISDSVGCPCIESIGHTL